MRPACRRIAAAGALGALALVPGSPAPASSLRTSPSRLLARGNDTPNYTLTLSRTKLPPGPSIVQFVNVGQDPHDLKIRRVGGRKVRGVGQLDPGTNDTVKMQKLVKGARYRLWCSLPNHADYGMEAYIKVKKKR